MLRKGLGADATRAKLKRAPSQKDSSRSAKLTNKNLNANYVAAHASALPPMVKLTARSGDSIQEQVRKIMNEHAVRLIDIFREWDDDGNGALDKKELRAALAALGYEAPKFAIDELFRDIDTDNSGYCMSTVVV